MNRGSTAMSLPTARAGICFNEAPIHESGKWERETQLEPTKRASMRPRFMNRGSRIDRAESAPAPVLQ